MSGNRHQIDVPRIHIHRDLAHGLRGVRVEKDLVLPAERANLLHRLDDTNLIVHRHDTDERGLSRADRSLEILDPDQPTRLHRQVRHLEPLILQIPARVQHALVLRLRRDDVLLLPRAAEKPRNTLDAHIITLRGAAREDNLLWIRANQARNMRTGRLGSLLRLPAVRVRPRMRVSIQPRQERQHGIQHPGIRRRRRLHVQVNGPRALLHQVRIMQDFRSGVLNRGSRQELGLVELLLDERLLLGLDGRVDGRGRVLRLVLL